MQRSFLWSGGTVAASQVPRAYTHTHTRTHEHTRTRTRARASNSPGAAVSVPASPSCTSMADCSDVMLDCVSSRKASITPSISVCAAVCAACRDEGERKRACAREKWRECQNTCTHVRTCVHAQTVARAHAPERQPSAWPPPGPPPPLHRPPRSLLLPPRGQRQHLLQLRAFLLLSPAALR